MPTPITLHSGQLAKMQNDFSGLNVKIDFLSSTIHYHRVRVQACDKPSALIVDAYLEKHNWFKSEP